MSQECMDHTVSASQNTGYSERIQAYMWGNARVEGRGGSWSIEEAVGEEPSLREERGDILFE